MGYVEKKRCLFFGLPISFTKYTIEDEKITVTKGFLNKKEDSNYMYQIVDVTLEQSLLQRIFGIGTIRCIGSDKTDPELYLKNIKNSKEVKDFIFQHAEEGRLKRRTLHTMNIGGGPGPGPDVPPVPNDQF